MRPSLVARPLGLALLGSALFGGLVAVGCTADTGGLFASDPLPTGSGAGGSGANGGGGTGGGEIPPDCGNGTLDANEDCDGALLGGASCADLGYADPAGLACTPSCTIDDSGCSATCDGMLLEPTELCDGPDLGGASCVDFGYVEANGLICVACALDASGCVATCGNDQQEPGETCDGIDLDGHDCTESGFVDPNGLACDGACELDTTGCTAQCNGVLEPGEVCDGADLGGASCTDFGYLDPNGLACTDCALDPSGCSATCGNLFVEPGEECDDGNTTPGDGCSDLCQNEGPTGSTCADAIPIALAPGATTVNGSNAGGGAHTSNGCSGEDGPDVIYAITPQTAGYLTASTTLTTSYDSVLYVANACSDGAAFGSILCADNYNNGGEVVSIYVQQGVTVYLVVDGWQASSVGDYELVLDLSGGRDCGDPVPIPLYPGVPVDVNGNNFGNAPNVVGSCGGNPGDEVVYAITRTTNGPLGVQTRNPPTDYNSVLYARSVCADGNSELGCSNVQTSAGAAESLSLTNLVAGTPVYVWVDGSQSPAGPPWQSGNFGLRLTP